MKQPDATLSATARPNQERTAPLSSAQRRLWFLTHAIDEPALHHCAMAVCLSGPLDVPALKQALSRLIDRHEILRTRFVVDNDAPIQVIEPSPVLDFEVDDLSEAAVQPRLDSELHQAFDLTRLPLLRARLLRCGAQQAVLSIVAHHIVFDLDSLEVLRRELTALYRSEVTSEPASLPSLVVQYADYAIWDEQEATGPTNAESLAYWYDRLQGVRVVRLPADRVRRPTRSYRGGAVGVTIDAAAAGRIRRMGLSEKATPAMTLLAGFAALLARYARQDDVAIGTVASRRCRVAFERLLGPFSNDIVLRVNLQGSPTFRQLVRQVRDEWLRAYRHQRLPFDAVVQALSNGRVRDDPALCNAMFAFRHQPRRDPRAGEHAAARAVVGPAVSCWERGRTPREGVQALDEPAAAAPWRQRHSGVTGWDIRLAVTERRRGLLCGFDYSTDLFDEWRVRQLAAHYLHLVAGGVDDPDTPVWRLRLTGGVAGHETAGAAPAAAAPAPDPIAAFASQVRSRGEAAAVLTGSSSVSYHDLYARVQGVKASLDAAGIGPEHIVAVLSGRSAPALASLLAIWQQGAVAAWVDPARGEAHCRSMLREVRPAMVLAASAPSYALDATRVVLFDQAEPACLPAHDRSRASTVRPHHSADAAAYIACTAGVSASPRLVVGTYRGLTSACGVLNHACPLDPEHRVLTTAAIGSDLAMIEVLWALSRGAGVLLSDNAVGDDIGVLLSAVVNRTVVIHGRSRACAQPLAACSSVSSDIRVCAGRDRAGEDLVRMAAGRATLLYGTTETAGWNAVLSGRHRPADPSSSAPLFTSSLYVLDGHLQPVPVGLPGDIHIGGAMVCRGYLQKPGETAGAFVADPFGGRGGRMFRTGDCGRWRPDGTLELLGRAPDVDAGVTAADLAAIEHLLRDSDELVDAVALLSHEGDTSGRTVAGVVARDDGPLNRAALQRTLARNLPRDLVPVDVIQFASIPETFARAVDVRAIAQGERPTAGTADRGDYSETERAVAQLWGELLDVPAIGVEDDFFAVGGHSLAVMRFLAAARRDFGVDLELEEFFDAPTVRQVASTIDARVREHASRRADHPRPA